MKNKFILTSALALALMLTGCGGENTDESTPAADNVSDTVADTAAEETQPETTETEAETSISDGNNSENDGFEEDADNDSFGETDKFYDGVFHGSGYTLKIDGGIWMDISALMDYVKKAANDSDIDFGIDFTAEQYSDAYDGMFICPDSSGANFNMTVVDMGMDISIDEGAELYGALIEQQYSSMEGCTFYGSELSEAGGYDCLKAELEMTSGDTTLRMVQYCFWENQLQMVITFTVDPDEYDEMLPEFEKVLNSVSFGGSTQTV